MPGYDAEFMGLKIAKSWGLTPAAWRALEVDDRALMMAFDLFEGTVEAYRDQHSRDFHAKKERGDRRSAGENEFSQMKRELGMQ